MKILLIFLLGCLLVFSNNNNYFDEQYFDNSWILNSRFNYKYPNDSILNLAYPSAIAQYYVTILPPFSSYLFYGEFLKNNIYESSLTVYKQDGNIDNNYPSLNNNDYNKFNLTVNNNSSQLLFVLQRFYANMNYYSTNDLIKNLAYVINLKNNKQLLPLNSLKRDINSIILQNPLEQIITKISPISTSPYLKFYLPNQNVSGLFPDSNHYYLFTKLGKANIIQVSGIFISSKLTPYMDFITVDQTTTETNYGIPFYDLPDEYIFYVTSPQVTKNDLIKYNISEQKILKWKKNNKNPALIFRIIDYSNNGISNVSGPLNPIETEKNMNYGFYPKIKIIEI